MKLAASALQQKLVGEMLGSNLSVRRLVGVHKPFIRAIEAVLRKPGLSWGKIMILCGGPDWPTSVLAGILRLSLWQVMLGTCPIIASVVPLVLTGSFYLKRDESENWTRTGNLMLSLTALISGIFWVGICSSVQDEFDKRKGELNMPKEEHVELEWLDHQSSFISEKCSVSWQDTPRIVWAVYVAGAFGLTVVSHVMFWFSYSCFGTFRLNDDIEALQWVGQDGLIRPVGFAVLSVAIVSYLGLLPYSLWHQCHSRGRKMEAMCELDAAKDEWMEAWIQKARRAAEPVPSYIAGPCLLRELTRKASLGPDGEHSSKPTKMDASLGEVKLCQFDTDLSPNWDRYDHASADIIGTGDDEKPSHVETISL